MLSTNRSSTPASQAENLTRQARQSFVSPLNGIGLSNSFGSTRGIPNGNPPKVGAIGLAVGGPGGPGGGDPPPPPPPPPLLGKPAKDEDPPCWAARGVLLSNGSVCSCGIGTAAAADVALVAICAVSFIKVHDPKLPDEVECCILPLIKGVSAKRRLVLLITTSRSATMIRGHVHGSTKSCTRSTRMIALLPLLDLSWWWLRSSQAPL